MTDALSNGARLNSKLNVFDVLEQQIGVVGFYETWQDELSVPLQLTHLGPFCEFCGLSDSTR